jgi:hypothetical protein
MSNTLAPKPTTALKKGRIMSLSCQMRFKTKSTTGLAREHQFIFPVTVETCVAKRETFTHRVGVHE